LGSSKPLIGNQVRHILIILISILLLSSPVIGNNHNIFHQTLPVSGGKGETSTKIYTNLVKFVYLLVVVKYGNILEMKNNNHPLKQKPTKNTTKSKTHTL
jgi:hypothetical protein|tara:strand:+ start:293 stop:592 length:300 start_codon:yes stop_codon:yes gene_type:complete